MKKEVLRSHCPINYAQEIFGDRWSLLVIRDMMFKQKKHYGEFLDSGEGISTNILANRLLKLETQGLVKKVANPESATRTAYALTPKGKDLLPMLLEMILWSARHDHKTNAPQSFINKLRRNREGVIQELLKNLES